MFDVALDNRTPFTTATHVQMDENGQEVLLLVLSASFAEAGNGLQLALEQAPVCFVDEPFRGGLSSIRIEADIVTVKPKSDIVVIGAAAYAPAGRPVPEVIVSLRVADIQKALRVSGDRTSFQVGSNRATPFVRMPIVYERAFGGTTRTGDVYLENPVGVGFRGAASADPAVATELPNIEYLDRRQRPPAGFGVVSRNWMPRVKLAGTYDQAWIDAVWPLQPKDFNPLFNQVAPLDQQTSTVLGGEVVQLTNLTSTGQWRFRIPRLDVPIRLIFDDRVEEQEASIDTVLIDCEHRTVALKSRISVTRVRNSPRLREIVMGHVSPAWLMSRQRRKAYHGRRGGNGGLAGQPTFQL